MKQLSKLLVERLKLNKDSIINQDIISQIDVNQIKESDDFYTIVIYTPENFKIYKNIEKNFKCLSKPVEYHRDKEKYYLPGMMKNRHNTSLKQILLYNPKIKSNLFCCVDNVEFSSRLEFHKKDISYLYILFNTEEDVNYFVEHYNDLYKKEIEKIYNQWINEIS